MDSRDVGSGGGTRDDWLAAPDGHARALHHWRTGAESHLLVGAGNNRYSDGVFTDREIYHFRNEERIETVTTSLSRWFVDCLD